MTRSQSPRHSPVNASSSTTFRAAACYNNRVKNEGQLATVADSYDRSVRLGRDGVDLYKDLPPALKSDPDYPKFAEARAKGLDSNSGQATIREYLAPAPGHKFVDLGCALNLIFNGYNEWPSEYHGLDISGETIQLLNEFVAKHQLKVGGLHHCSIDQTPYRDEYFHIGACIGVLEYFERDFVKKALNEAYRILKPGGRFVLDIPDNTSEMRRIMNLVECSMGRPDKFDLSPEEFEKLLEGRFTIEKVEPIPGAAMIQYYLLRQDPTGQVVRAD